MGPDAQDHYLRTDDLSADLGLRTARGGVLTVASQIMKFGSSMIATVVLARLLTPEDYGLVGMVGVVTGFISIFKDLGLSTATVQKTDLSRGQIDMLFWINVAFSVAIAALTVLIAPAVAWFYGEPRLVWLTSAYAGGFILGGLTVQHEALLRRRMRFAALATTDVASLIAGITTAIVMAWFGARYWALLASQLVQGLVYAVGVWIACRWRPGLPARNVGARSMLAFGRNLTGFSVANYFARNLDNMLIGRYWGSVQLGLYARAYQLLLLPIDQINTPISTVAVPALSRLTNAPERYRSAYLRLLEKVAMLTMPLMAFMIASCDWIVLLVLGPKWTGVIRIFAFLGVVGLVQPVCGTTGWLFITQGRTHHMLQWGIIGSTLIIASIVAGLHWGAVGVAASYSVGFLCVATPLLLWFVGREGPVRTGDIYRAIAPSMTAALGTLGLLAVFRSQTTIVAPLPGIAASLTITAVGTLLVLVSIPAGRRGLQDLRHLSRYLIKGGVAAAI